MHDAVLKAYSKINVIIKNFLIRVFHEPMSRPHEWLILNSYVKHTHGDIEYDFNFQSLLKRDLLNIEHYYNCGKDFKFPYTRD